MSSLSCLYPKPLASHMVNDTPRDVSNTYTTRVRHSDTSPYRRVRASLSETLTEEKKWKKRAFSATARHVEWLERLIGDKRHYWRRHMAKQYLTRHHVPAREFLHRTEDRRMKRCFPTRLPPECRSERDALVGVLVAGMKVTKKSRRKKLPTTRCSNNGCGFYEDS